VARCIYCKDPLPSRTPREHVIPKGLTAGFSGNLTIRCVCSKCNEYFGREFDSRFVEDTLLGVVRYLSGLKADTRRARLPRATHFRGTYLKQHLDWRPDPSGVGYTCQVAPQVGFATRESHGREWRYFRLDDLESARQDTTLDTSTAKFVGLDAECGEKAKAALAAAGICPSQYSHDPPCLPNLPPGTGQADVELVFHTLVDAAVKRCMAKMAFNYLAYVTEKRTGRTDWLMCEEFNAVRAFVRQPDGEPEPTIGLADVRLRCLSGGKELVGHFAALTWERDGRDLVASVSLLSSLAWRVTLAKGFSGVWWDVSRCHFWGLNKRRVVLPPRAVLRRHEGPPPERPRRG
jgi:hypothetical protein